MVDTGKYVSLLDLVGLLSHWTTRALSGPTALAYPGSANSSMAVPGMRALAVRSFVAQRTAAAPRRSSLACRRSLLSRGSARQPQDCRMRKYCVQGLAQSTNIGSVSLP